MLIQSHSLLAKLLDSMLCQKTLVSLGATALPSHVGSEGEGGAAWRRRLSAPCSQRGGQVRGSHSHDSPKNQVCFVDTDGQRRSR